MKTYLSVLAVAAATLVTQGAKAELITYDFTATVTAGGNIGLLNAAPSAGDSIYGSFTIDHSITDSAWGGSYGFYAGALVDWDFQLQSDTITGQGGNLLVRNSWDDTVSLSANQSNSSLQINGVDQGGLYDAQIALLHDDQGTALGSDAIPDFSSLNLDDFETQYLGAAGLSFNGAMAFSATFDSITLGGGVSKVPELDPAAMGSTVTLVASAATVLRSRRRRA